MAMQQIGFSKFQNDFKKHIDAYTLRLFEIKLKPESLEDIFSFENSNERHIYPLFFYCYLGEDYLHFYLDTNRRHYIYSSLNMLTQMIELYENDPLLESIVSQLNRRYSKYKGIEEVKLDDRFSNSNIIHGTQKFFWSFLSKYLR
jgi:hypothetical protein